MSIDRQKVIDAAQKYAAKNQLDKAIVEYQRVLREDPQDVRILLKVGDLQVRMNARQAAIDTYTRVAVAYDQQGFFLKAIAVYKQILQIDPNLVQLYLKLAELYVKLGLGSDALQHLDALAQRYARSEDNDALIGVYRRMLQVDGANIGTRIRLAELFSKLNRGDEAASEFEAGCNLLDKAGRTDDWARVAERLFFHRSRDTSLAKRLAAFYLDRSDPKRALPKLQVAYKADPRDIATLELLAGAFRELGQLPKTVSVLKETARIHGEAGNVRERNEVYQRVLELAPNDTEAREALRGGAKPRKVASVPPARAKEPSPLPESLPAEEIDEVAEESDLIVVEDDVVFDLKQSGSPEAAPQRPQPAAQPVAAQQPAQAVVRAPTPARGSPYNPAIPSAPKVPTALGPAVPQHDVAEPAAAKAPAPVPAPAAPVRTTANSVSSPFAAPRPYAPQNAAPAQVAPIERGPTTEALRLVGEAEIFIKYGLRPKALDHLTRASRLDPHSVDLHTRLVELYGSLAEPGGLLRELILLAQLVEREDPRLALAHVARALEIDPTHATARALHERLRGPVEPPPEETLIDEGDVLVSVQPVAEEEDLYAETARNPPVYVEEVYRPEPEVVDLGHPVEEFEPPQVAEDVVVGDVEYAYDEAAYAQPAAPAPRREIEESLDEAEFFITQGLYDDALELLRQVLEQHPNHPLVLERWEEVEQLVAVQNVSTAEDRAFVIAEKLAEEVESLTPAESAPPQQHLDEVESVFSQFKAGISRTVSPEDCDTHYDLGIAYKEMGLLDDAIAEFRIATMSPARQCIGEMMIGLCFMEKGDVASAINSFRHGLQATQRTEHEELGLYYEMGTAYEYAGDATEALYYLQKVEKRDPTFRNVRGHIQRLLANSPQASPSLAPALDELDRAFDDLVKD